MARLRKFHFRKKATATSLRLGSLVKKMQEIGHNAMSFGASRLLDCCQAVNFHHAQATPAHVAKNNRQCVRSFKVLTDRVVPYIDETIGSVADADHNARFATVVVLEGLSV